MAEINLEDIGINVIQPQYQSTENKKNTNAIALGWLGHAGETELVHRYRPCTHRSVVDKDAPF